MDNFEKISDLLFSNLGNENPITREQARIGLLNMGEESIPVLKKALDSNNVNRRMEAAKALGTYHTRQTNQYLAKTLMDDNFGVRWIAMQGLINQGRDALNPVLEEFVKHFDSVRLGEGVHHVLHVLKEQKKLNEHEIRFFKDLERHLKPGFHTGWIGETAWTAESILERLDQEKQGA